MDKIRHIGYACTNTELQSKKVKTSTIRKATVDRGGNEIIADTILHNLETLLRTLEWNVKHHIKFFRISSDLFPWMGTYNVRQFKRFDEIEYNCGFIGEYARENKLRLEFHPGPFNVLCSPDDTIVSKTIRELEAHSEIFDLMGYSPSFDNDINIHVGGAYGDKTGAMKRWVHNWSKLNEATRQRVVVENDDKPSMYSVKDLHELHKMTGRTVPITFDYFHHSFHGDGVSEREALEMAISTWPKSVVPVTHYSESRRREKIQIIEDIFRNNRIPMSDLHKWPTFADAHYYYSNIKYQAHSDFVDGPIDSYGNVIDVMLEAKAKEQALFGLRDIELKRKRRIESPLLND